MAKNERRFIHEKTIALFTILLCVFGIYSSTYAYQTISYGLSQCYAIKNDNTLWQYDLENGTSIKLLDNVKSVDRNYAVKNDNTLWSWNKNVFGEFDEPTMVMSDVDNISASWEHLLVVKEDKSLWRIDIEPAYLVKDEEGQLRGINNKGEYVSMEQREHKLMNNVKKICGRRVSYGRT